MTKSRKSRARKPYTPPTQWDTGPNTQAQRRMKVVEDATWTDPETGKEVNPNGVRRARRLSVCETYRRQGLLSKRQASAAEAVLFAWERNQRTPPAIKKVNVDTSSKPDAHIAILIDRVSAYVWVIGKVPSDVRGLVEFVCRDDNFITALPGYRRSIDMQRLRVALDDLADEIGLSGGRG